MISGLDLSKKRYVTSLVNLNNYCTAFYKNLIDGWSVVVYFAVNEILA